MHFLPLFFTLFTITLNGERVFMELSFLCHQTRKTGFHYWLISFGKRNKGKGKLHLDEFLLSNGLLDCRKLCFCMGLCLGIGWFCSVTLHIDDLLHNWNIHWMIGELMKCWWLDIGLWSLPPFCVAVSIILRFTARIFV